MTTRRGRSDHPGITLHRTRRLHPDDVTAISGIPVTSLARTVLDLADVLRPSEVPTVIHEAEVIGLDSRALEEARRRVRGRDTRVLVAALRDHRPRTPREIEDRLEAIALRAGLEDAQRNAIVEVDGEPFELDRYYPTYGSASRPTATPYIGRAGSSTRTAAGTGSSSSGPGSPCCATPGRTSRPGRPRPSWS